MSGPAAPHSYILPICARAQFTAAWPSDDEPCELPDVGGCCVTGGGGGGVTLRGARLAGAGVLAVTAGPLRRLTGGRLLGGAVGGLTVRRLTGCLALCRGGTGGRLGASLTLGLQPVLPLLLQGDAGLPQDRELADQRRAGGCHLVDLGLGRVRRPLRLGTRLLGRRRGLLLCGLSLLGLLVQQGRHGLRGVHPLVRALAVVPDVVQGGGAVQQVGRTVRGEEHLEAAKASTGAVRRGGQPADLGARVIHLLASLVRCDAGLLCRSGFRLEVHLSLVEVLGRGLRCHLAGVQARRGCGSWLSIPPISPALPSTA